MNDCDFLKSIFHGYVNYYGALRWHTKNTYADMTQIELNFFCNLGLFLGYLPIREYTETYTANFPLWQGRKTNPRDLVWIDRDTNSIFLHLERENDTNSATQAVSTENNKLLESARFNDNRVLLGVFGWVTDTDFSEIKRKITTLSPYSNRNILIISFIGRTQDDARDLVGVIYTGNQCLERHAVATLDANGYWYSYFDNSTWRIC